MADLHVDTKAMLRSLVEFHDPDGGVCVLCDDPTHTIVGMVEDDGSVLDVALCATHVLGLKNFLANESTGGKQ